MTILAFLSIAKVPTEPMSEAADSDERNFTNIREDNRATTGEWVFWIFASIDYPKQPALPRSPHCLFTELLNFVKRNNRRQML